MGLHKLDERFAAATEPANHRQLGWRWWEQNEDASWKATSSCPWFCKQGWFWQADAYAKPACCNEVRDSSARRRSATASLVLRRHASVHVGSLMCPGSTPSIDAATPATSAACSSALKSTHAMLSIVREAETDKTAEGSGVGEGVGMGAGFLVGEAVGMGDVVGRIVAAVVGLAEVVGYEVGFVD